MGSRLSPRILWTRRACSTPVTNRSTLYVGEATTRDRSLWRFNGSRTSFYCAMMVCLCAPGGNGTHSGTKLIWGGSTEFAFYINRGGRGSRKNFLVRCEGAPTRFGESTRVYLLHSVPSCAATLAFQYPYVLAFEPTFVEIRNVETGSMSQVIQGNNLCCLSTDTPPSLRQAYTRMPRSSLLSYNNGSPGGSSFTLHSHSSFPAYGQQPLTVYSGQLPTPPVYPGQQPPQPYGRGLGGREEIILVSDDPVLTLRMALPEQ